MKEDEIKEAIKRRLADNEKDACNDVSVADAIVGNVQNEEFISETNADKTADCASCDKNGMAVADKNSDVNENNKQGFGKFKNPEELLRAYGELERQFTKKSQRLKELERELEEPFASEEEWKNAVDKFFERTPSAKPFAKDIANEIISNPQLKNDRNCLNIALTSVLLSKFKTPEELMNDGQFLDNYVLCSDKVKDAVIAGYLNGLRNSAPPMTLSNGGLQCVAPARKIKSIEEAGILFLKNNK